MKSGTGRIATCGQRDGAMRLDKRAGRPRGRGGAREGDADVSAAPPTERGRLAASGHLRVYPRAFPAALPARSSGYRHPYRTPRHRGGRVMGAYGACTCSRARPGVAGAGRGLELRARRNRHFFSSGFPAVDLAPAVVVDVVDVDVVRARRACVGGQALSCDGLVVASRTTRHAPAYLPAYLPADRPTDRPAAASPSIGPRVGA